MRKILLGIILSMLLSWLGIFLFVQYKTNAFIEKFTPSEVKISYEKLYILPGIKHPLTIIVKNIKAIADGVIFNTNIYLYPSFSSMLIKMDLSVNHDNDHFSIPMIITSKKSANKNFYLDTSNIDHAIININGSQIAINGGIKFHPHSMPIGSYDISISDTQKLLESNLLTKYPRILYKVRKILDRIDSKSPTFKLDYTETGMKLDGIPIENL